MRLAIVVLMCSTAWGQQIDVSERGKQMYTVTFIDANTGENKISRYTETKRVAINWAKWLRKQSFVSQTTVYQGMSGEMVIDRQDVAV